MSSLRVFDGSTVPDERVGSLPSWTESRLRTKVCKCCARLYLYWVFLAHRQIVGAPRCAAVHLLLIVVDAIIENLIQTPVMAVGREEHSCHA